MKPIVCPAIALVLCAAPVIAGEWSGVDGSAVASSDFEDPGVCRGCHPQISKRWNVDMVTANGEIQIR